MARQEIRERKRISIKSALRGQLATISGAAAATLVQSYAEACFRAYVASLPCRTGITQFSAQIALQGWPGEIRGEVLHSAKRGTPILEHKNFDAGALSRKEQERGVFVDNYRVPAAQSKSGSGSPDAVKVQVAVKPGFARRMVQAAQPGSRSKIKALKLTMWAQRMAYDEPISSLILTHEGIPNFPLTPFQEGDTRPRTPFNVLLARFAPDVDSVFFQKAVRAAQR